MANQLAERYTRPLGYVESATTTAVQALPTPPAGASRALIQVSSVARWRDDGTNPTTAVGMRLTADTIYELNESQITGIRIIGEATCVVRASYYGR